MKSAVKYFLVLGLLIINLTCSSKDSAVDPVIPQPVITNLAPGNLTTTSAALTGKIDLGGNSSVSVLFEYGLTTSYGSRTSEQTISSSGTFTVAINGLNPGTTYHWRINYKTSNGDLYSRDTTFTTLIPNPPVVTNLSPGDITIKSASLHGKIDLQDYSLATVQFECGLTTAYEIKTSEQTINSSGNFYATLADLKPGSTYHWRISCKTSSGMVYSSDTTFTTLIPNPPVVTNLSPGDITINSASLHGKIDLQDYSLATVQFECGLTTTYEIKTAEQTMNSSGNFYATLANLKPGSTYHWRISCKTSGGVIYSDDATFETQIPILPKISNPDYKDLTTNSAALSGEIDPLGYSGTVYFEYGLTTSYGSTTPGQAMLSGIISAQLNNLTPGTAYHWRIHIVTNDGDVYSNDNTFTTLGLGEFNFPLSIGQKWTYSYKEEHEYGYLGTPRDNVKTNGSRIWEVKSRIVYPDKTVYNLTSEEDDKITITPPAGSGRPVEVKNSKKTVQFTIVVDQQKITLNDATDPYAGACPRWVAPGTTTVKAGDATYLNGTGLLGYNHYHFGQTGYLSLSMTLVR